MNLLLLIFLVPLSINIVSAQELTLNQIVSKAFENKGTSKDTWVLEMDPDLYHSTDTLVFYNSYNYVFYSKRRKSSCKFICWRFSEPLKLNIFELINCSEPPRQRFIYDDSSFGIKILSANKLEFCNKDRPHRFELTDLKEVNLSESLGKVLKLTLVRINDTNFCE